MIFHMWELWYCFMFLHHLYNEVVGKHFVQHSGVSGTQIQLNTDCLHAKYIFHLTFFHPDLSSILNKIKIFSG
jgi:hypothetical protein